LSKLKDLSVRDETRRGAERTPTPTPSDENQKTHSIFIFLYSPAAARVRRPLALTLSSLLVDPQMYDDSAENFCAEPDSDDDDDLPDLEKV
jgi:hypothetical protein